MFMFIARTRFTHTSGLKHSPSLTQAHSMHVYGQSPVKSNSKKNDNNPLHC